MYQFTCQMQYYDWADDSHQGTNSEQDRFWGYNKLAQDWH